MKKFISRDIKVAHLIHLASLDYFSKLHSPHLPQAISPPPPSAYSFIHAFPLKSTQLNVETKKKCPKISRTILNKFESTFE